MILGSNGPSGTPPGIPLGLDLVRFHERDFLHPVGGVPLHDVVDEVAHQSPFEDFFDWPTLAVPRCVRRLRTVRGKFSAEPVFRDYRLYSGFGLL